MTFSLQLLDYPCQPREIVSTIKDEELLNRLRQEGLSLNFEQPTVDAYLDNVIPKPWGIEYRVFQESFYDLWELQITAAQATSLHCHLLKQTLLLCLEGKGQIDSLTDSYQIQSMDWIRISQGAFHRTSNTGNSTLKLIEVESPCNKLDLVRVDDGYGREGKPYESQYLGEELLDICYSIDILKNAKIRSKDLSGSYEFTVQTGINIMHNSSDRLMFAICLDLKNALSHNIEVFPVFNGSIPLLNPDSLYFTISRSQQFAKLVA